MRLTVTELCEMTGLTPSQLGESAGIAYAFARGTRAYPRGHGAKLKWVVENFQTVLRLAWLLGFDPKGVTC